MLAKLITFRLLALAAILAALAGIAHYPLGWPVPALVLGAYMAVLAWRPHWWLYVLPASLPLLNLYPWTGWLFIEEFDLAVLGTLAVGYLRASPAAAPMDLTRGAKLALAALALSYLASLLLALNGAESWSWASLISYNTPLNALRVVKGFLWPLLLLPLLLRAAPVPGFGPTAALSRGLLAGVVTASIVVVWERWAFPGLLNFSSDYRAIGPFYEAHVGGAALDGFLALSLPFAAIFLLQARSAGTAAVGTAVLGVGAYASFATFSRGLYLGIALAGAVIAATRLVKAHGPQSGFRIAALSLAFAVSALLSVQVFASGGYRTLAALLGAYAGAVYFGGSSDRIAWRQAVAGIVAAGALTLVLTLLIPKGAYVAYGLAMVLAAVSAVRTWLGHSVALGHVVCAWLALAAIAVGWHWGGARALEDAALAVAVGSAFALYNRSASGLLWTNSWRAASVVTAGLLMLGLAVPIAGNYFMKTRVQATSHDLKTRESHWMESVAVRGGEWPKPLAGAGLGSYAERFHWNNQRAEFPGTIRIDAEGGRSFLRLGGARNTPDVLRLAQRVPVSPGQTLNVEVTARSAAPKTQLRIDVCEKWLLYTERCTAMPIRLRLNGAGWSQHSAALYTGALGSGSPVRARPTIVMLQVDRPGTVVDIAELRLLDSSGRNLIANGSFAHAGDHWFFTSDRSHLPWHAKNLWLGIWFDQGWFGVAAFVAVTALALVRAFQKARAGAIAEAAIAAALAAFFTVGLFDTLLDATRLAFAFYLLCFAVLAEPATPRATRRRRRRSRRDHCGSSGTTAETSAGSHRPDRAPEKRFVVVSPLATCAAIEAAAPIGLRSHACRTSSC